MAKRKKTVKPLAPSANRRRDLALPGQLLDDVRNLILRTREGVAQAANAALVLLYCQVGQRIRTEILQSQWATYGEEICSTLSNELAGEFGTGFSRPNLTRMIRFAEVLPDRQVVAALAKQLSWSHFVDIIYLHDPLQRDFYAEMCRIERWSVRTLHPRRVLPDRVAAASLAPKEVA